MNTVIINIIHPGHVAYTDDNVVMHCIRHIICILAIRHVTCCKFATFAKNKSKVNSKRTSKITQ